MARASLICSNSALPVESPAQLDRRNHVADDYLAAIIEARDRIPGGIQVARLQAIKDKLTRDPFEGLTINTMKHVYWQDEKM
ncbi:hypothetical protein Q7P36_004358 [Cladosporium allicinum]